ncbi:MAG: hypothetical protein JO249_08890 [Acidobacteria bacterium]|nr:hypothetical protein [Acidobacteriota bacterium]
MTKYPAISATLGGVRTWGKPLIAGLLTGLLLTVACSRKSTKPANVTSSLSTALSPSISPSATRAIAPPLVKQKPAPQKAARKHSSMVTYKDERYRISLRYPRKYTVKTGEDLDSDFVGMNFVQPGGMPAVGFEMPSNSYPGSDLTSALFQVNVNRSLSEAECAQFALSRAKADDRSALAPVEVQIGDMHLRQAENIVGESTKQVDTKYYHVFENGACYEFALGLMTDLDGNEEGVNRVDREEIFRRLERILAAVKITPETSPALASGTRVTSPIEPRQPDIRK